jgi:hypothetical protein
MYMSPKRGSCPYITDGSSLWVHTGQRDWTCLIFGHFHELVMPPQDTKGTVRDPDGRARTTQLLPDKGCSRC